MNKNYFYKYKKYKLKYQNLLNQKAGSIDELRDYLREASEIFQIVNNQRQIIQNNVAIF